MFVAAYVYSSFSSVTGYSSSPSSKMSLIPPEPTKAEIDQLRSAAVQKIDTEGVAYDLQDVKRIMSDDKYIQRFLMHHDNDQKLALDMVMETLKWRHENQCNCKYFCYSIVFLKHIYFLTPAIGLHFMGLPQHSGIQSDLE